MLRRRVGRPMTWSAGCSYGTVTRLESGKLGDKLTVHMGYEYLAYLRYFESLSRVLWGLKEELSQSAFSTVYHCVSRCSRRSTIIPVLQ